MNQSMKERCELFIQNRDAMKGAYKWDGDNMAIMGSVIYTGKMVAADVNKMKEAEEILKKKAGVFSEFRGNLKLAMICNMAMSEDAEAYFEGVNAVYKELNKNKLFGSDYRLLAAMIIYGDKNPDKMAGVERAQKIFQDMKKEHPFLTSDEDITTAAMLAISDMDIDAMIKNMEECYGTMKKFFSSQNAVQSLSHVLALNNQPVEEKCQQVKDIFENLKDAKRKYGTSYELATLGALTMLDMSTEEIVKEICEVDDYLKEQKGFGSLGTGRTGRLMYAALLVMDNYMLDGAVMENAVVGSTLATVIAQQMAMICIMTAATASTTVNN